MDSLKELFKIGNGPSSSHTMGPERAAKSLRRRIQRQLDLKWNYMGHWLSQGRDISQTG